MFNKYVKYPVDGFYSTLNSDYILNALFEVCSDERYNDTEDVFAKELFEYFKGEGQ